MLFLLFLAREAKKNIKDNVFLAFLAFSEEWLAGGEVSQEKKAILLKKQKKQEKHCFLYVCLLHEPKKKEKHCLLCVLFVFRIYDARKHIKDYAFLVFFIMKQENT